MSFDSTGLTPKRYAEIVEELNTQLRSLVGTEVDTTENSLIGNMHSNIALSLAQLWELAQDVYDAGDLYSAEGASLENLARMVGVSRNPTTQTRGTAFFTGDDGITINEGSRIISVRGDEFQVEDTFTIRSDSCVGARLYVEIVQDTTDYRLVIDDVTYTYTSDASATITEIIQGLESVTAVDGTVTTTAVIDGTTEANSYLLIERDDNTSTSSLSATSYLSFDYVITPAIIHSTNYGAVPGDALAINEIASGVTGWYSVSNPSDLTLGRNEESDTELRTKVINDYGTVGSSTIDSIGTAIKAVEGVAAVTIRENTGVTTDGNGVPPKSYEVIVHEGQDADIAEALWKTKPAGIYIHGDTSYTIKDFNDYDQVVRFTRPEERYIFIDVRYSPYTEEELPSGAEDNAKLAMLQYADDNLGIDDDIIAKRFLGSIYGASTGFGDITIQVASSNNPLVIPTYPADYVDVEAISDVQISSFATDRMTFTQV